MNETKSPLKSLGIVGPAVAILVFVANQFFPGLGLTEAEVSSVVDNVVLVAGAVLGIYGRWKATKAIG